jgi:hypothetical protein
MPALAAASWLYWLIGAAATMGLLLLAEERMGARNYPQLGRQLTERLTSENILPARAERHFVQFGPDPYPSVYEGFTNWDIGLLILTGDRLCYVGEQARFALTRAQIIEARMGPGHPSWQARPLFYITWRDPVLGINQTFYLRAGNAATCHGISRETVALAERVRVWRQEQDQPAELPAALAVLTTPERRAVTGSPAGRSLTPKSVLSLLRLYAFLALGVSLLAGLSLRVFSPLTLSLSPGEGWYVLAVSALTVIFQIIPTVRYRQQNR